MRRPSSRGGHARGHTPTEICDGDSDTVWRPGRSNRDSLPSASFSEQFRSDFAAACHVEASQVRIQSTRGRLSFEVGVAILPSVLGEGMERRGWASCFGSRTRWEGTTLCEWAHRDGAGLSCRPHRARTCTCGRGPFHAIDAVRPLCLAHNQGRLLTALFMMCRGARWLCWPSLGGCVWL